jgi:hypothetical protein
MGYVLNALWQGIVAGAVTKTGPAPQKPVFEGFLASIADALYALGYTVASIVVHGRSPG